MNSLHRLCVMSHLVSQVPSAHPLLDFPRASLVLAWLALRKGGGIAVAFVMLCLLSRCCVTRAGRLLQHGGMSGGR